MIYEKHRIKISATRIMLPKKHFIENYEPLKFTATGKVSAKLQTNRKEVQY